MNNLPYFYWLIPAVASHGVFFIVNDVSREVYLIQNEDLDQAIIRSVLMNIFDLV